jgi:hypothetical protein
MRDWTYRPGRGEAEVALYEPTEETEGRSVAVVSWRGDDHLVLQVPGAYFDKILVNLRRDPVAARDLLNRATRFIHTVEEDDAESVLAGLADFSRLRIPGKEDVPLPAPDVRSEFPGKPMARVRAKLMATNSILGATTHFKLKLKGQNATIAELGFWGLWDWMILLLLEAEEHGAVRRACGSFAYQLSLYQAHNVPGFRELGAAPLAAATAPADHDDHDDDDASITVDDLIEHVRNELAGLATTEDGTPLVYPEWFLHQRVKMEVLWALGLLDPESMAAYEAQRAAGDLGAQEAVSGRYTAALDRAIEENGLASVVETVFEAVTTTDFPARFRHFGADANLAP